MKRKVYRMKKVISAILALVIIFAFSGCGLFAEKVDISGNYTLNGVVSLKATEENSTDKVTVSYEITITGSAEDIAKVKKQKTVVNEEYEKLLVESGDETVEKNGDEIVIKGSMIFDTSGKSKEEIADMTFIQGVEITDEDGNKGNLRM